MSLRIGFYSAPDSELVESDVPLLCVGKRAKKNNWTFIPFTPGKIQSGIRLSPEDVRPWEGELPPQVAIFKDFVAILTGAQTAQQAASISATTGAAPALFRINGEGTYTLNIGTQAVQAQVREVDDGLYSVEEPNSGANYFVDDRGSPVDINGAPRTGANYSVTARR